jgi:hypothetical protein
MKTIASPIVKITNIKYETGVALAKVVVAWATLVSS